VVALSSSPEWAFYKPSTAFWRIWPHPKAHTISWSGRRGSAGELVVLFLKEIKMLCPLKFSPEHAADQSYKESWCEKEKCAWWNRYSHNVGTCAIRSIALRLDDLLAKGLAGRQPAE
jgi:hypothetical protein